MKARVFLSVLSVILFLPAVICAESPPVRSDFSFIAPVATDLSLCMLLRGDDYVHIIPSVDLKGCTKADLEKTKAFAASREKLKRQGLISGRSLIYAQMLLIETFYCSGDYKKEQYCAEQELRLKQLEIIYTGAGKPIHESVPVPGHHLRNVLSLRSRCAK